MHKIACSQTRLERKQRLRANITLAIAKRHFQILIIIKDFPSISKPNFSRHAKQTRTHTECFSVCAAWIARDKKRKKRRQLRLTRMTLKLIHENYVLQNELEKRRKTTVFYELRNSTTKHLTFFCYSKAALGYCKPLDLRVCFFAH